MRIITKNKTTELIKLANNNAKIIVCHSKKEAHRIFDYAEKIKCNIHLPITYEEFVNGRYYVPNTQSVLVDNVDMLIKYISRCEVEAITLEYNQKNIYLDRSIKALEFLKKNRDTLIEAKASYEDEEIGDFDYEAIVTTLNEIEEAIAELEGLDKEISSIISLSMLHDTDDEGNCSFRIGVEDILSRISNE